MNERRGFGNGVASSDENACLGANTSTSTGVTEHNGMNGEYGKAAGEWTIEPIEADAGI